MVRCAEYFADADFFGASGNGEGCEAQNSQACDEEREEGGVLDNGQVSDFDTVVSENEHKKAAGTSIGGFFKLLIHARQVDSECLPSV